MKEHAEGNSASTAPRRPFIPLLCEYYFSKTDAMKREMYLKTWTSRKALKSMLGDQLEELSFTLD